jgi:hypothetical protein
MLYNNIIGSNFLSLIVFKEKILDLYSSSMILKYGIQQVKAHTILGGILYCTGFSNYYKLAN